MVRDPVIRNHVIQTIILRLNEKQAMYYFQRNEISINPKTWYKCKKILKAERFKRIREIFDFEAIDEYLQSIDTIKDCISKMYQAADDEPEEWKKASIYRDIIDSQPLLTEYYHNTRKVIEKDKQEKAIQEIQA